jgi:FKBP-type peptidyl-prolyl cis-trans isomerase FkpA
MNFKFPLAAAFVALLSLTACGGGSSAPSVPVENVAALTKTDTIVGTGALAALGNTVTVHYTGYLYTAAAGNKGTQFDSSTGKAPLEFKIGASQVIPGFDQGVTGMKVGGKRTVLIPSSLGYGPGGNGPIPGNSGLTFDIELVSVK